MKIAIHQPNFCPWVGYFAKIASADKFVFLDTAQFSKGSYQNRVKIKTPQGPQWLTANISKPVKGFVSSNNIELQKFDTWKTKHLKTIEANYSRSRNFSFFFEKLVEFYNSSDHCLLNDFNIGLIKLICVTLNIKHVVFINSSSIGVHTKNDDALIDICTFEKATEYLSGEGGRAYQQDMKFHNKGIKVQYEYFEHPIYPQLWGDFVPGLSILDLMLNHGDDSRDILMSALK